MSKNTVKPGLTPKRAKRVVENTDYASFTRRILRGYARRVASGDIEALRHLVLLPCEVDAITRTAVTGLREFGYSWAEIADRLGVSRQAVQMRYGTSTEPGARDRRVVDAGLSIGLTTLVAVFADHCRGIPAATVCPTCRYQFGSEDVDSDCPTNRVVRPLLQRRRHERPSALEPLTPLQMAELVRQPVTRPEPHGNGRPVAVGESLFDPAPYQRRPAASGEPVGRRRATRRRGR
jgi:hypothetical protein